MKCLDWIDSWRVSLHNLYVLKLIAHAPDQNTKESADRMRVLIREREALPATCANESLIHVTSRVFSTSKPQNVLHSFAFFWGPLVSFVAMISYWVYKEVLSSSDDATASAGWKMQQGLQQVKTFMEEAQVRMKQATCNDQCMLFTWITESHRLIGSPQSLI